MFTIGEGFGGSYREGLITMAWDDDDVARGLDALRAAVAEALLAERPAARRRRPACCSPRPLAPRRPPAAAPTPAPRPAARGYDDAELAASSEEDEAERTRLIALVELARRATPTRSGCSTTTTSRRSTGSSSTGPAPATLAEDLTSETFFRALRSMNSFRWQGKDFGAWLMTIARNLATDHFKAGRTRLELTTEDMGLHDDATEGPESTVLAGLTNEILLAALTELPAEQRDCLVMRFLQGMSIAETAAVLGRSDGAVKQLQLRGVRNLAKLMPEGIRD